MKDIHLEHHIQTHIFNSLVTAKSRKYSELKPKSIESNAFMYHMRIMLKNGMVQKSDGVYELTPMGRSMATRFSVRKKAMRVMPSTISVIVLKSGNDWLLYERSRQPFIGAVGFASGKIHMGETLRRAAYRELGEKCGYNADEITLDYRGVFSLVDNDPIFLENHVIGHVWVGEALEKRIYENHAGRTFWCRDDVIPTDGLMLGTVELIEHIRLGKLISLDLEFD